MKEIIMPKLGETMEEGTITKWLKREGERVEKGEPVAEVMTDKATFEIESPAGGFLRKILEPAGDTPVPVTRVIGYLADRVDEAVPASASAPAAFKPAAQAPSSGSASGAVPASQPESAQVRVSPRARKLAADRGIDLSGIKGSGPGGRIVEKDIPEAGPSASPAPKTQGGMQKAAARRMAASKREIPHFYVGIEVDMTEAGAARAKGISFNDVVLKAAARALEDFPRLNAHYENDEPREKSDINICAAVDTPQGLAAPVVKQASRKTLAEISARMKELKEKAKSGRFSPQDLESGTFTVSNLGMLGADSFCAIVNPPQVGILAVGSIREAPAVRAGQVAVRKTMRVTLSADHRAVDGAYGARFLARLKEILEKEHERL